MTQAALSQAEVVGFIANMRDELNTSRVARREARQQYCCADFRVKITEDLLLLWCPRILKAIGRDRHSVTNRWSGYNRSGVDYASELRGALGSRFVVRTVKGRFRDHIQVSWE